MTETAIKQESNWVVDTICRHPMLLGFFIAGVLSLSGLGWVKYQQHEFKKQPASSATLAELPICAKKHAEVRIAQRQLLTNGDLMNIQAECDAPANTLEKQSEALSENSLPRK
jgi:hypothetical protein